MYRVPVKTTVVVKNCYHLRCINHQSLYIELLLSNPINGNTTLFVDDGSFIPLDTFGVSLTCINSLPMHMISLGLHFINTLKETWNPDGLFMPSFAIGIFICSNHFVYASLIDMSILFLPFTALDVILLEMLWKNARAWLVTAMSVASFLLFRALKYSGGGWERTACVAVEEAAAEEAAVEEDEAEEDEDVVSFAVLFLFFVFLVFFWAFLVWLNFSFSWRYNLQASARTLALSNKRVYVENCKSNSLHMVR